MTVEPATFRRALVLASGPVERRATVPVLSTIRCRANGQLQLESSDLDVTCRAELPFTGDSGEFNLPDPHRLIRALNLAGGETVDLRQGEKASQVVVASGQLEAALVSQPFDDHPGAELVHFPEWSATIVPDAFRNLARLQPAMSVEETRYYLNGICIAGAHGNQCRFASTDGHRLHFAWLDLPDAKGELPEGKIFPRRWFDLAIKAFAKANVPLRLVWGRTGVSNRESPHLPLEPGGYRIQISGEVGGIMFTLASRAIDGTFPAVDKVVPTDNPHRFTVDRMALIRAIRALEPFSDDTRVRALRLSRAGESTLAIAIKVPSIGDPRIEIAAEGDLPEEIGFNGKYLRQIAEQLRGDTMQFDWKEKRDPAVITDPADTLFQTILMPMAI